MTRKIMNPPLLNYNSNRAFSSMVCKILRNTCVSVWRNPRATIMEITEFLFLGEGGKSKTISDFPSFFIFFYNSNCICIHKCKPKCWEWVNFFFFFKWKNRWITVNSMEICQINWNHSLTYSQHFDFIRESSKSRVKRMNTHWKRSAICLANISNSISSRFPRSVLHEVPSRDRFTTI